MASASADVTEDLESRSPLVASPAPTDAVSETTNPLYDLILNSGDRSDGSDELHGHGVDGPSRFAFSRQRANLLRPFSFSPGQRILEVGARSGPLTRYLGETGAEVVALEPDLSLAGCAAARCEGLANVRVVAGPVESFEDSDGFDAVLCVASPSAVAEPDWLRWLPRLQGWSRGALIVASRNPLGLAELLGHQENPSGEAWASIEHVDPALTRYRLSQKLADAGFGFQNWLFPFPGPDFPRVVLSQGAYGKAGGPAFVDQLVRWPFESHGPRRPRVCDERRAHRGFLEAGLGPEVAPAFLIAAAAKARDVEGLLDSRSLAWHFGDDRMRRWLATKRFTADQVLATPRRREKLTTRGWLHQARPGAFPRVAGESLEQRTLEACELGLEPLRDVLTQWRTHLRRLEGAGGEAEAQPHPFRSTESKHLLPPQYIDVGLANFIVDAEGVVHYIDPEWQAASAIDADVACARGLFWFAVDLVIRGVQHPWPPEATVAELAEAMGNLCGTPVGTAIRERLWAAEAELQTKVGGGRPEDHLAGLQGLAACSQLSFAVGRRLPFVALARKAAAANERLLALTGQLDTEQANRRSVDEQIQTLRQALGESETKGANRQAQLDVEIEALKASLAQTEALKTEFLQSTESLLADHQTRLELLRQSVAVAEAKVEGVRVAMAQEHTRVQADHQRELETLRGDIEKAGTNSQRVLGDFEALKTMSGQQVRDLRSSRLDLTNLESMLRTRETLIASLRVDLEEYKARLESATQAMEERGDTIESLERQIAERDGGLTLLGSELWGMKEQVEVLVARAATRTQLLRRLAQEARAPSLTSSGVSRRGADSEAVEEAREMARLLGFVADARSSVRSEMAWHAVAHTERRLKTLRQGLERAERAPLRRLDRAIRRRISQIRGWPSRRSQERLVETCGLFDPGFYLDQNPDAQVSGMKASTHYLVHGALEGRDPHPLFRTAFYLQENPDVRSNGVNPLIHFCSNGFIEDRDPHPLFDLSYYLERNPDIRAAGVNPLLHYLAAGWAEGRDPHPLFDSSYYLEQNPDVVQTGANPLLHYVLSGTGEGRNPHSLFDTVFYLDGNPDVRHAGANPLEHFIRFGAREGRDPYPFFDTSHYLEHNPDVRQSDVNPLHHFFADGSAEGRNPGPLFDTTFYLRNNPDVRAAGINPLFHFVNFGAIEGRDPHPVFALPRAGA